MHYPQRTSLRIDLRKMKSPPRKAASILKGFLPESSRRLSCVWVSMMGSKTTLALLHSLGFWVAPLYSAALSQSQ